MAGLSMSFQSAENKSMLAESLKEYALASTEAAYKESGDQASMGFMA